MRAALKVALEVTVNGFPVPIGVQLYSRTASASSDTAGFKLADPDGNPVKQTYVSDAGWSGTIGQCARTMTGPDGHVHLLGEDALEQIKSSERTTVARPQSFAPLHTVDFETATGAYAVLPDSKFPGADRSIQALWNGLLTADVAYMTQVTFRAGSGDKILAVYADSFGLWAVTLPRDRVAVPAFAFDRDESVGDSFAANLSGIAPVRDFDGAEFPSAAAARKAQVIEAVLGGYVPAPAEAPVTAAATPDLMSLLSASVDKVRAARAPENAPEEVVA